MTPPLEFPARQDPDPLAEGSPVATTGEPVYPPRGVGPGFLGPEPCNSPTAGGPCSLRLGHRVGPDLTGYGGHLP